MSLLQWPAALRAAGLTVYEHNGWPNTPRPQGDLADLQGVFWHHDASPAGRSPGALDWIIGAYNAGQPAAQIWVDYDGGWHFVGTGYASHAGVVRGGLTSRNCVGVETDHTINEPMNANLLGSLRRGFAAICKVEGRGADFVTMHKIEADPRGRKTDPYFTGTPPYDETLWDGQLARERAVIQQLIDGGTTPPVTQPPAEKEWDDMASEAEYTRAMEKALAPLLDAVNRRGASPLVIGGTDRGSQAVIFGDRVVTLKDPESVRALLGAGAPFAQLSGRDYDSLKRLLVSEDDPKA